MALSRTSELQTAVVILSTRSLWANQELHRAWSLGLIIMRGRCVSGHVVRESLSAVRLGYVTEMH